MKRSVVIYLLLVPQSLCAIGFSSAALRNITLDQAAHTPHYPIITKSHKHNLQPPNQSHADFDQPKHQPKPIPNETTQQWHKRLHFIINGATFAYILWATYQRYQTLGIPNNAQQTFLQTIISRLYTYATPTFVQSSITHASFGIDVACICVKALFYKAIASMILACATCSIFDATAYAIKTTKSVLKTVVW